VGNNPFEPKKLPAGNKSIIDIENLTLGEIMPESIGRQSYHEVKLTKDLRSKERTEDLVAFINKHIAEYKGKTEEGHPIPVMLFEEQDHAHIFANQLSKRLDIPREHITVKAQK
jgi:hypothetical protein